VHKFHLKLSLWVISRSEKRLAVLQGGGHPVEIGFEIFSFEGHQQAVRRQQWQTLFCKIGQARKRPAYNYVERAFPFPPQILYPGMNSRYAAEVKLLNDMIQKADFFAGGVYQGHTQGRQHDFKRNPGKTGAGTDIQQSAPRREVAERDDGIQKVLDGHVHGRIDGGQIDLLIPFF